MKSYKKYKDSGIEWIGTIPEHWSFKRLKYVGKSLIGLTYSPNDVSEDESGYLVLRSSNIQNGKLSLEDNVYVKMDIDKHLITQTGDILICARNGSADLVGKNILIDERTKGQTFGAFMTVFRTPYSNFVYWYFNSPFFDSQKGAFSTSTINQLTSGILNNLLFVLPPSHEQTTIANFLDAKTTEINQNIADKEQLITLYEEEKKALINEAVTKGLNPKAKLKPSGVDWLGDIPEHWEVKRLKFVTKSIQTGKTPPTGVEEYFANEDYDWFTPGDFDTDLILTNSTRKISQSAVDDEGLKLYESNTILLVSIGATLGKVGIVSKRCFSNQQINAITFNEKVLIPYFGCYFLDSYSQIILMQSVAATLAILNQEKTKDLLITVPPIKEQEQVIEFIHSLRKSINDKINLAKQEIELLKEYRQALIFEAVTGKIDVTNN